MTNHIKQQINKFKFKNSFKVTKYFLIIFTILSLFGGVVAYLHPNLLNNNNKTAQAAFPTSRDPYQWPFSRDSIWNMPIGSGAQYSPKIGFKAPDFYDNVDPYYQGGIGIDEEPIIIATNNDPLVDVYETADWSYRCNTTNNTGRKIHFPSNLIFESPDGRNGTPNYSGAVLQPNGTLYHFNAIATCGNGKISAYNTYNHPNENETIYQTGSLGGHGGSGLSGIGGSIRKGELLSSEPIRHAIKLNVLAARYLKETSSSGDCALFIDSAYKWPADRNDGYAGRNCDTNFGYLGLNASLKMGSLVALPPTTNIQSLGLTNPISIKLMEAFRDYGAYIVDDTHWNNYDIPMELGVAEEVQSQKGIQIAGNTDSNSSYYKDTMKIFSELTEITNNTPTSIGGGGTPRAPLAPCFTGQVNCTNTTTAVSTTSTTTTSNPVTSSVCTSSTVNSGNGKSTATVMLFGDSTTAISSYDTDDTKESTYRKPLWDKLMTSGYNGKVDFIGTGSVYGGVSWDEDHNGYGGFSTKTWYGSPFTLNAPWYPGWNGVLNLKPDIIHMMIGINDQYDRGDAPKNEAQLSLGESEFYWNKLITDFRSTNPNVKIFVDLHPGVGWTQANESDYFNMVKNVINNLNNTQSPITWKDLKAETNFIEDGTLVNNPSGDTVDGVHQNYRGAEKIATVGFNGLKPLIDSVLTGGGSTVVSNCSSTTSSSTTSTPVTTCNGTKLTGTVFGAYPSYADNPNVAFDKVYDDNTSTYFDYVNPNGGYVGLDLGANKATLNRVCIYPRSGADGNNNPLYTRSNGAIIQGSDDNINYTNILTVTGTLDNQWKDISANNITPYRYYRYLSPDGSYGNLAEIKFFGVVSSTSSTSSSTAMTTSSTSSTATTSSSSNNSSTSINSDDCFI